MTHIRSLNSGHLRLFLPIAALALGLAITPHYGESWDERQFFKYADRALEAYSTWPRTGSIPLTGNTYDNYGPAYVMLTALGARLLGLLLPWSTTDLRHLVYFATFALGIWAFHRLCRRWLGQAAALGATLLMATQPVIWGHAFISPKDVPFLTFFVLSIVLGLEMVDVFHGRRDEPSGSAAPRWLPPVTAGWLCITFGLILSTPLVHSQLEALVRAAATGQANIIAALATDIRRVDPAVYVEKFFVLFLQARGLFILVATGVVISLWRKVPGAYSRLGAVAPAAITLGFSASVRVLGPLAALIVAAYAIRKLGWRALPTLLSYGLLALFVMYATWPYLWPDPVGHLIESVSVMSRYPWTGAVLFNGTLYDSTGLPAAYLPVLLAFQFTETAWLLIVAGSLTALVEATRERGSERDLLILALGWCVLPLVAFIAGRSPLYDNFRQVLFTLPPLFMLAGLAFQKIRRLPIRVAVIALAILPAIVEGAGLHPYEYIYYNRLIGGVQGAFRKYELDYWGTSYREAAQYLNQTAAPNASVWVEGPAHLLHEYTRPDLKIFSKGEPERLDQYDYVVALTRFDLDLQSYPGAPIEQVVQRQGALLTVIKRP
jgi:hypothetical protein